MISEKTFKRTAFAWLAASSLAANGASGDSASSTQAVQRTEAPAIVSNTNQISANATRGNQGPRFRPDLLPLSKINSLAPDDHAPRSNRWVRIQGVVLEQGLGEYVIIRDDTGSIRAETRQTLPIGSGERVTAWGRAVVDGSRVTLSSATIRPLAWDSISEQKIVPAPGKPDQLPVLAEVRAIRELSPSQAAWKYPVRVRGVVTALWQDNHSLFVQDETAGIFTMVPALGRDTGCNVGDVVEITGVSGPGSYAPIIESGALRILGKGDLPEARLATLYQMAMGQFDAQWVEVRGVVRSVRITRRYTDLQLSDINGLVEVNIVGGDSLTNLVDSLVHIRGVCASRANSIRQLTGAYIYAPGTNFVFVDEKAVTDSFTLPTQTIASLSEFSQRREIQHRVKIAGVVTFNGPGRPMFVQDATGGVPVYLLQSAPCTPGDRVEVAGYVMLGDFGFVLRNASCRVTGHADIPAPKTITTANAPNQNLHGQWVEMNARLVSSSRRGAEDVITLQSDATIFEAIRPGSTNAAAFFLPPPGSQVLLRGVYSVLGDDSRMARAFRLYIPAAEAVETLERATWWNAQHTMSALGIMVVIVLAAALWAITLRRKIRQQTASLQQSEMKFRSLVEQSLMGVYIIQGERFAYVNPRLAEIYGYSQAEMIQSLTLKDSIAEEDLSFVQDQIRRRIVGEIATVHYSFRARRKDGSLIFVEVLGSRTEFNGRPAVLGTLLDITERRQAEMALAQASTLLETLLENSPDHIYFKDRESRFVRYSKSFADLLHAAGAQDLVGKTDFELFTVEHAQPAFDDEQQIIRTGVPIVGKLEKETHKDGNTSWALTNKLPWRDKDGNIIGTFGISKDVTAIKQAEHKLDYERALFQNLLDTFPDTIYFKDLECRFVRFSRSKARKTYEHVRNACQARLAAGTITELPPYLASEEIFSKYLVGKTDFDTYEEKQAQRAFEEEQRIIRTAQPVIGRIEHVASADGNIHWLLVTKMPWRDTEGNIIGTFGVSREITAVKEAEERLAYERELFYALVDNLPDNIYFKDRESRFVRVSKSKVKSTLTLAQNLYREKHPTETDLPAHLVSVDAFAEFLIGKTDFDTFAQPFARGAYEEEQHILKTAQPIIGKMEKMTDGRWMLVTKMPWRDKDGNIAGTFGVSRDITALKQAEAKLEVAHQRLVETSRLAGMAEVATDVLHNVGNVLNSVNVSCSLSIDRIKASKTASLAKVSGLLHENRHRLTEFLTQDPRGQQIVGYVSALSEHLSGEQVELLKELEQLLRHIDHIKQIVSMQQNYAKVAGVAESVSATQMVEDALHMNAAALTRHDVHVRREFEELPAILTEKHKVLQILVNLIRNAKYAMDEAKRQDKLLTIKVGSDGNGSVKIQVIDNGVGIPQENLTRIFSHGFTTRPDGHGFGLHSSALAVRDLGGTIQAHSDGQGKGAMFTLLLPMQCPAHTEKIA